MEADKELEACRFWVQRDFSMIPNALIQRAFKDSPEDLELLVGGSCAECGEPRGGKHHESCPYRDDPEGAVYEPSLAWPAGWGWLFRPDDPTDRKWFRDHLEEVAKCEFLVYKSDETDILLAIDGGGYDIYEEHWLPLYRARGLSYEGVKKRGKGSYHPYHPYRPSSSYEEVKKWGKRKSP